MSLRVLVIGACGQIGTALVPALRLCFGAEAVVASDIREPVGGLASGPFVPLDVQDADQLERVLTDARIEVVYHLAALLSARGEQQPMATWQLNAEATFRLLEIARQRELKHVFIPSSIAVFGLIADRKDVSQVVPLLPTTIYGITKLAGERLGAYYWSRYGLDVRSLRYPGLVSMGHMPGGGTTDYAIDMMKAALSSAASYDCYLNPDTRLPMMHMEDAIRATMELMAAPRACLSVADAYNLTAMSFTPRELAAAIQRRVPAFRVRYVPDDRQKIADSWPETINDSIARKDWAWQPRYETLLELVAHMFEESRSFVE